MPTVRTNKHFVVVGLGPHAKRIYIPFLARFKRLGVCVELVIDLEDQREKIDKYIHKNGYRNFIKSVLYLPSDVRCSGSVCPDVDRKLSELLKDGKLDAIIISSEPKAHKQYAEWALRHDIDILMDKPVTSPVGMTTSVEAARQLFRDYEELDRLYSQSKSTFIVQAQRRYHRGYCFIKKYMEDTVEKYGLPVSYIDLYHADGMWNMPDEFLFRENHPYKYGYGKLMHSGYHFIDLLSWLLEVNAKLPGKNINNVDIMAMSFHPKDFLFQINADDYSKLLKTRKYQNLMKEARLNDFGELDVFLKMQFKHDDLVVTTANVDLQQNSFSRRAWSQLPEDTYKGNGRVRHERANCQISHLLNVQVHSYQSYEVNKKDVNVKSAGNEDHFDITLFRNTSLIGGRPFRKIALGEQMKKDSGSDKGYLGHNEYARYVCLQDFIKGRKSASDFSLHRRTNKLVSSIYECLAQKNNGGTPFLNLSL